MTVEEQIAIQTENLNTYSEAVKESIEDKMFYTAQFYIEKCIRANADIENLEVYKSTI